MTSNKNVLRGIRLLLKIIFYEDDEMTLKKRKQQPKGAYATTWIPGSLWARIEPMLKERGDLSAIIIDSIETNLPTIEKEFQAEAKQKGKRPAKANSTGRSEVYK
jgi:hypothetical protein